MRLSVIIPVLDESKCLAALLDKLTCCSLHEIIVIDGGSTDNTIEIAESYHTVKIFDAPRGRASQLNSGASRATGDILVFLHADSEVSNKAFLQVEQVFMKKTAIAGSFYLKFDKVNFWLNLYSKLSKINHCVFTYGDQGLFVEREIFNKIGGFRDIPIMEDLEIQQRLRKAGPFIKLNHPIITSARRFEKNGIISQQIKNILLVTLYLAGIPAVKLKKYYQ